MLIFGVKLVELYASVRRKWWMNDKKTWKELVLMSKLRQQILILHLATSSLESQTVAWAFFDGAAGAEARQMQSGDTDEPPYNSVLAAMQDGWRVIQLPSLPIYIPGHEHETGHLPYEYVLERMVELDNL